MEISFLLPHIQYSILLYEVITILINTKTVDIARNKSQRLFIVTNHTLLLLIQPDYSIKVDKRLYCYQFRQPPRLFYSPINVEIVHLQPYIIIYHNLLTTQETEKIKALATPTVNLLSKCIIITIVIQIYNCDHRQIKIRTS